jgi:hypothetical protein
MTYKYVGKIKMFDPFPKARVQITPEQTPITERSLSIEAQATLDLLKEHSTRAERRHLLGVRTGDVAWYVRPEDSAEHATWKELLAHDLVTETVLLGTTSRYTLKETN